MNRIVVLAASVLLLSGVALADTTNFTFSYVGSYFSVNNGSLVAQNNGNGSFTALSGTGTLTYGTNPVNSYTVSLYPIPGAPTPITVRTSDGTDLIGLDNQLFPTSAPMLYVYGLIFEFGATPLQAAINIYFDGSYKSFASGHDALGNVIYDGDSGGVFTLTDVPEASTMSLLITMLSGVVGLAGIRRKKLA